MSHSVEVLCKCGCELNISQEDIEVDQHKDVTVNFVVDKCEDCSPTVEMRFYDCRSKHTKRCSANCYNTDGACVMCLLEDLKKAVEMRPKEYERSGIVLSDYTVPIGIVKASLEA